MKGYILLAFLATVSMVTTVTSSEAQFSSLVPEESERFRTLIKRQAAAADGAKGKADEEDDDDVPWKHCPLVACPQVVCTKPGPQECKKHEDCGNGKKCCTFCCWTRKCH